MGSYSTCVFSLGDVSLKILDGILVAPEKNKGKAALLILPFEFFDGVLFPFKIDPYNKLCMFRCIYNEFSIIFSYFLKIDQPILYLQYHLKALRDVEIIDVSCPLVLCNVLKPMSRNCIHAFFGKDLQLKICHKTSHILADGEIKKLGNRAWSRIKYARNIEAYGLKLGGTMLYAGDVLVTNLKISSTV